MQPTEVDFSLDRFMDNISLWKTENNFEDNFTGS